MRRILSKFSVFELLTISLTAALGVAVKPAVSSLARIITGPLAIPGGVLAGGIYMMFPVLAYGLTCRRLAGTLTALVQALIVVLTGIAGSQGIMSFVTYLLPGAAVDLVMLLFSLRSLRKKNLNSNSSSNSSGKVRSKAPACFCAGIAANLTGSLLVSVLLFNIPLIPLLLSLAAAALSGGLGGLLAYFILKQIYKLDLLPD